MVLILCMHASLLRGDAIDQLASGLKQVSIKKTPPPLPPKPKLDIQLIEEFKNIDPVFADKLAKNVDLQKLLKEDNRIKTIFQDYPEVRKALSENHLSVLTNYVKKSPEGVLFIEFIKRMRDDQERKNINNEWPVELRSSEQKFLDDLAQLPQLSDKLKNVPDFSKDLMNTYLKTTYASVKALRELLFNPSMDYDVIRNNLTENEFKVLHNATLTDTGRKQIQEFVYDMSNSAKRNSMKQFWPFTDKVISFYASLSDQNSDQKSLKHFLTSTEEGKEVGKHIEVVWKDLLETIIKNKSQNADEIKQNHINLAVATLLPYREYLSGSKKTDKITKTLLKDIKESDSFQKIAEKLVKNPEDYIKNIAQETQAQRATEKIYSAQNADALVVAFKELDPDFAVELNKPKNKDVVQLLLKDFLWRRVFVVANQLRDEDVLEKFAKDLLVKNELEAERKGLYGTLKKLEMQKAPDSSLQKAIANNQNNENWPFDD